MIQQRNSLDIQQYQPLLPEIKAEQYSNLKLYFRTFIIIQGTFLFGATLGNYNQVQNTMYLVLNDDNSLISGICNSVGSIGAGLGSVLATLLLNMLKQRRYVMIFADLVAIIGFALQQYPYPFYTLYAGRFFVGISQSLNVIIAQIYLKEFLPDSMFGNHINLIGFSIQIGILFSFFLSLGLSSDASQNTAFYWRIMLGFPALFPLVRQFFLLTMFRDDTPVYYLKQKDTVKLEKALKIIFPPEEIKTQVKILTKTFQNEDNSHKKSQTLLSIFSKDFRMRLFLAQIVLLVQPLSGITIFTAFTTQIYQLSVSFEMANTLSIIQMFWAIAGLIIAQRLLQTYGRKTIFMGTMYLNAFQSILLIISSLAIQQNWVEGGFLIFFKYCLVGSLFIYNLCIGLAISSVCFIIVAELVPKAGLSIVNVIQYSISAILSFSFPIFTNSIDMGYFFMILCFFNFAFLIILGIFLKETKGKNELEISLDYNPKDSNIIKITQASNYKNDSNTSSISNNNSSRSPKRRNQKLVVQ